MWEELKTQLLNRRWVKKINESDLTIRLVNNSQIQLRSADNYDALRGSKYNFIVLDECADIQPETWYSVLRPTLSDTGGSAMFIGSPKGRDWFYDLWIQAHNRPDWRSWQFTTLQGGRVPESEIEAARRDLDARTFRQEYEAEFVDYSGVIFWAFSEDNMRPAPEITLGTPLHIGLDFNVDPMSAVICVKIADTLHVIDEIEIYGSNTLELCSEIRNRYGNDRQILVYPDASGQKRTTNSAGISDHLILHNNGFRVITNKFNPVVSESIADVNSLFRSSDGACRLFIAPGCRKLRECLLKFSYKEGTRVPDKGVYDHMTDALRYVVSANFSLQRETHTDYSGSRTRTTGRMIG